MNSVLPSPDAIRRALDAAMDPPMRAIIFVSVITIHAILLIKLGSRRRCSRHPVLRFTLWSLSAAYLPFMSYVLSYMTTKLWDLKAYYLVWFLVSIILLQFLKAKADMEALAVAAVASPVAGDDDINSLKVRPSLESLFYSSWVAGLVIYNIFIGKAKYLELDVIILLLSPLWALGSCRMVLKFIAFHRATGSFALGRNVQLIDGYMGQLQEAEGQLPAATVPRLIVTGERKRDVEESALGYRVKPSALEDEASSLVTLERVWSESDHLLVPQLKDLCLSFALFKCLRRRFAGFRLSEVGSSWAFHFVRDGLLGREDDHERTFRVIASELMFASDFYYSPLPVASLGSLYASLHFLLSVLIFSSLCLVLLFLAYLILLVLVFSETNGGNSDGKPAHSIVPMLPVLLAIIIAWTEMSEMIASVRSNWTKISIVGHYMRSRNPCARRIFSCLLGRCKAPRQWKDEIGQIELFTKPGLADKQRFIKQRSGDRKNQVIQVPPVVKASILCSFRSSGGQLSAGTAAVRRQRQMFSHDIAWACLGEEVTTTTDAILVWWIATGLFQNRYSPRKGPLCSNDKGSNIDVALCLSRYCAYLVAEVPDLLPDSSAWTKCRYKAVTEGIDVALQKLSRAELEAGHLVDHFSRERSHEVLNKGSRLGKQLLQEAGDKQTTDHGEVQVGEEKVWKLLAEFWSEMLLYLAPSDNIKGHIQVLQRGGELITLLWVLLLHAGIISRPARHSPEP